jgi:hypothetical protein
MVLLYSWRGTCEGVESSDPKGREARMAALVVVLLVVTVLLCLVVTGLLRSHADIIRALHSLGVGVGDPGHVGSDDGVTSPVHLRAGPPLPSERSSTSVHDIEGVTPSGDAIVASMATSGLTLLAFLSSGCASCAGFWAALADPAKLALLPTGIRVVVVTKGPEWESPEAIAAKAPRGTPVVMSTDAWGAYEVPGSPYFALVDGEAGVRVGEGVGAGWEQVADLVHRAEGDAHGPTTQSRAKALGLDGPAREQANDAELLAAGITPGHPSLYPQSLEDVFASTEHLGRRARPSSKGA